MRLNQRSEFLRQWKQSGLWLSAGKRHCRPAVNSRQIFEPSRPHKRSFSLNHFCSFTTGNSQRIFEFQSRQIAALLLTIADLFRCGAVRSRPAASRSVQFCTHGILNTSPHCPLNPIVTYSSGLASALRKVPCRKHPHHGSEF